MLVALMDMKEDPKMRTASCNGQRSSAWHPAVCPVPLRVQLRALGRKGVAASHPKAPRRQVKCRRQARRSRVWKWTQMAMTAGPHRATWPRRRGSSEDSLRSSGRTARLAPAALPSSASPRILRLRWRQRRRRQPTLSVVQPGRAEVAREPGRLAARVQRARRGSAAVAGHAAPMRPEPRKRRSSTPGVRRRLRLSQALVALARLGGHPPRL